MSYASEKNPSTPVCQNCGAASREQFPIFCEVRHRFFRSPFHAIPAENVRMLTRSLLPVISLSSRT